jgi:uncharacterized protein (DUF2147 family)
MPKIASFGRLVLICNLLALTIPTFAGSSPVGLWKTVDERTQREKSLIRIVEQRGELVGRIEKLLTQPDFAECIKCEDDRKGRPLLGMEIIRRTSIQPQGLSWVGGQILDPQSGRIYQLVLTPSSNGETLEVRGYLGLSVFGRSQVWLRQD